MCSIFKEGLGVRRGGCNSSYDAVGMKSFLHPRISKYFSPSFVLFAFLFYNLHFKKRKLLGLEMLVSLDPSAQQAVNACVPGPTLCRGGPSPSDLSESGQCPDPHQHLMLA